VIDFSPCGKYCILPAPVASARCFGAIARTAGEQGQFCGSVKGKPCEKCSYQATFCLLLVRSLCCFADSSANRCPLLGVKWKFGVFLHPEFLAEQPIVPVPISRLVSKKFSLRGDENSDQETD